MRYIQKYMTNKNKKYEKNPVYIGKYVYTILCEFLYIGRRRYY